jgi:hypothetical protein
VTVTNPTNGPQTTVEVPGCEAIPEAARDVLTQRCATCHGPASPEYGGFNDATDPDGLIADGWVIPNDPDNSRIFQRIDEGTMPNAAGGGALVAEEVAIIDQWIQCGAESWELGSPRGFIGPEVEFRAARNDANNLDFEDAIQPDQPNARYFSLVPLYNAGVPAEDIKLYATALSKLAWSLSNEDGTPPLVPVRMDGLLLRDNSQISVADGLGDSLMFRLDQKDFGWDNEGQNVDVWEEIVKAYPYAIPSVDEFDDAEDLQNITKTRIPIIQGDWFLANASLPPLYFDVLDIPNTIEAFYLQFGGIDIFADFDIADIQVDCAGMNGQDSLVSEFNRVICRHQSINGYCWESFDFAGEAGDQNIFNAPDQFINAKAGGESFCSLENGQQVYLVYDAAGNRLNNAPINVVSDYTPGSGGEVKTGLHCINCHNAGVIERDDAILDTVLDNESDFDDNVVDFVLEAYPGNDRLADIYADDIAFFTRSLEDIGVDLLKPEPVWNGSENHEAPSDLARIAAQLGLPEGEIEGRLAGDDDTERIFSSALANGGTGTIARESFDQAARDTICELELGDECDFGNFCGLSAVPCIQGSQCLANGECTKVQ